jgi:hypothetical protein
VEPQTGFLDIHVSPDAFHESATRDDFAGALDENCKQIEGAADGGNRLSVLLQSALSREEAERTESKN